MIHIESDDNIPLDDASSIYKAAKLFRDTYHIQDGFLFQVHKNIPIEAGLGGESSDAAGTLLLLNHYYHFNLDIDELCQLGIQIGSDVPFFLHSGFQMVFSIGDMISKPSFANPFHSYIVIKPDFGLSTKDMFHKIDSMKFERKNIESFPYNDFMKVVPSTIFTIRDYLNDLSLSNHTLSGSGSSYYVALFEDNDSLYEQIQSFFPQYQVFLIHNCNGFIIE